MGVEIVKLLTSSKPPERYRVLNHIGTGYDSSVFRYHEFTVKVYKEGNDKNITADKVKLYETITRNAFYIAESEQWLITTPFSNTTFPIKIVPFELLYDERISRWVGISDYIPGISLASDQEVFDRRDLESGLKKLSSRFDNRLEVCGIEIIPLNTKLVDCGNQKILFVTDLCADLEKLKHKTIHKNLLCN